MWKAVSVALLTLFAASSPARAAERIPGARLAAKNAASFAQEKSPPAKDARQSDKPAPPATQSADDISGMYTFLRDGEFVQVDVEDGVVSGFVSRYGDTDSDRGAFLDHMFKSGSLEGNKLRFQTRVVHGVWYEFSGTVERGEGKTRDAEAYYVLKGTLTQKTEDAQKNVSARERAVEFKSFPADAGR